MDTSVAEVKQIILLSIKVYEYLRNAFEREIYTCGGVDNFTCICAHACVLEFGSLAVVFWVYAFSPETSRDSWECVTAG